MANYSRIETERLLLREWEKEDEEAMFLGLNDFDVAKNLTVPYPYTREDAKSFIDKRLNERNNSKKLYFAIVEKKSSKVIGGTSISVDENMVAEGGIWINKEYHHKGYGTETFRARAKFCFEVLGCEYLTNGFLEGNEISCHMQQKVGYKLTGSVVDNNSPARGGKTKEIKTILTKEDFYLRNV